MTQRDQTGKIKSGDAPTENAKSETVMENKGWVSHYRRQHDHWVSKIEPYCAGYAWTYLYTYANHEERQVPFKEHVITVQRGQLVTSIKKLAEEKWHWGYKKTSNFLNKLEENGMIRQKRTSKYTLITVVNYDEYQCNNHKRKNNGKTKEKQRQTNNNKHNKHPLLEA